MPPPMPPQRRLDHGRSWFVLFGAFLISASTVGNSVTLSTLFKPVVDHVKTASGEEASTMSIIVLFALVAALNFMGGAISTIIIPSIGYRLTIAIGASLAMLGYGCSAAATRVWHLYLTMGVLTGLGFGICYTPANGVLSYYFSQKLFSFAGSVASTGIAAGVIGFSYIHPGLMASLPWHSAMLSEAAVCVLLFSSALAVRESDVGPSRAPPPPQQTTGDGAASTHRQQIQLLPLQPPIDISNLYNKLKFGISRHQVISIPEFNLMKSKLTRQRRDSASTSSSSSRKTTITTRSDQNSNRHRFVDGLPGTRETYSDSTSTINTDDDDTFSNRESITTTPLASLVHTTTNRANKIFSAELYKNFTFYMMLIEGMGMLVMGFFFLLTPNYLIKTHGWSDPMNTSCIFISYGVVSLVGRIGLSLLNFFGGIGRRVPIAPQIGLGLALLVCTSIAFLCAPTLVDTSHSAAVHLAAAAAHKNETFSAATNSSHISSLSPPALVLWYKEPNAILLVIFSGICGFGGTLFGAYQVPLLFEVVPKECLTAAFACQNLVLGVFQLALCPVPVLLANAFGSLRLGYVVCLGFSVVSMIALVVVVVMIRRNKAKQDLAQIA